MTAIDHDGPARSQPPRNLALDAAADALADWGFLAQPGQPSHAGPGYLLVAVRPHPTFTHFDPETVAFWITRDGVGQRICLDRQSEMPFEAELAWGPIRITDRLHVSNEYLTFGGAVTAAREDGTTVIAFVSPAPLLRRGGHSQGWDLGAQSVGAFFARLVAVAGRDRSFERGCCSGRSRSPGTRHSSPTRRMRRPILLDVDLDPLDGSMLRAEAARLRRDAGYQWEAGQRLAAALPAS